MRTWLLCIAILTSASLASAQRTPAQAPAPPTLITAGHLLDPRTGRTVTPAAVLVEDGKIKQVGAPSQVHAAPGVTVIDLGGGTLMPGLIDGHSHLMIDVTVPAEVEIHRYDVFQTGLVMAVVAKSPAERVLLGAQMARENLDSGFTTVRNLGFSGIDGDAVLRDAIAAGRVLGSRILASGRKIIAPGDYLDRLNPALAQQVLDQEFLTVLTVDDGRRAIAANLFYNVDLIKVAVDDDGVGITAPVLRAMVQDAHLAHKKVAAHAQSRAAIQIAIDAGVDSIEHGNAVTDEQLAAMRARGIFFDLTPTFFGGFLPHTIQSEITVSPAYRLRLDAQSARQLPRDTEFVRRILRSGVKLAVGSDMCWFVDGLTRGQASALMFNGLRDAGMPALDIIRAVTTNAAEMLGWQDRIGGIEPGKLADLVATPGDPVADIAQLQHVGFVMKGGEVVKNALARP